MIKKWMEKMHPVMEWIGLICTLTGQTIFALCGILGAIILLVIQFMFNNLILTIRVGAIVIIVSLIVYIIIQRTKYRQQIEELNNRITVCQKVIMNIDKSELKDATPVDKYLICKEEYDEFKTKLKLSECTLKVVFVKNAENPEEYDFVFKWELKIKNPSFKSQNSAKFIYSGAEKREDDPHLDMNIREEGFYVESHGQKNKKKVLADDRFMQIVFNKNLKKNEELCLDITYTFKKYKFDRNRISIWIVPDTLGFADLDKFFIYFYIDGEIVREETDVTLQSYRIDAEYKPEIRRIIEFEKLNNDKFEGKNTGFKAKSSRNDKLHGYGYQLELINH